MGENLMPFFRNFFRRETTTRAIRVASIIAPILIVMNHYDEIIDLRFTPVFFFKSALTFFVPYFVSAYSSAKAYSDPKSLSNPLPRN
jgi:hypothetical protein